jgi:hypothetical protein
MVANVKKTGSDGVEGALMQRPLIWKAMESSSAKDCMGLEWLKACVSLSLYSVRGVVNILLVT